MVPLRLRAHPCGSRFRRRTPRRGTRGRGWSTVQGRARAASLLALLLALAPWAAHGGDPAVKAGATGRAALDSLVRTEQAFAALSVRKGMREAFLTYLADSGLIFRPLAVNGKRAWEASPSPAGTLSWEPSYAEVSAAGDLGYTTGPWEYRAVSRPTAYGHFVSIWKRQGDGRWRVELDTGVSHAKPERGVGSGDFTAGPEAAAGAAGKTPDTGAASPAPPKAPAMSDSSARAALKALDREYSQAATDSGLAGAFAERAAADVRLDREGALPVAGLAAASAALDSAWGAITWIPQGAGIAASRDLGYTYGVGERRPDAEATTPPDSSVYLHVWRKGEKGWKLALAVENPLPKRAGN